MCSCLASPGSLSTGCPVQRLPFLPWGPCCHTATARPWPPASATGAVGRWAVFRGAWPGSVSCTHCSCALCIWCSPDGVGADGPALCQNSCGISCSLLFLEFSLSNGRMLEFWLTFAFSEGSPRAFGSPPDELWGALRLRLPAHLPASGRAGASSALLVCFFLSNKFSVFQIPQTNAAVWGLLFKSIDVSG